MNLFPTMCTGLERHAEAFAEHTQAGIDRILNVSSKRTAVSSAIPADPQQPMCRYPDLVERSALPPSADTGTAGVSDSLNTTLRWKHVDHERFVGHVLQLLKDARFQAALDAVQDEYDALHGPQG